MFGIVRRFSTFIRTGAYYINKDTRQLVYVKGEKGERIAYINITTTSAEYKIEEKKSPDEFAKLIYWLEKSSE